MIHATTTKFLNQGLLLAFFIVLSCQYCLADNNIDLSNVKFEVICEDSVSAKENINVEYILDYGDQFDPNSLELRIPVFISDYATLKYLARSSSSKSISNKNGKMTTTNKIKWGVTIKPLKEGQFTTPEVILLNKNDTVPISQVSKTVIISNDITRHKEKKSESTQKDKTKSRIPDNAIIRLISVIDRDEICLGDSVIMKVKLQSNQESFRDVKCYESIEIDDCFYESKGWNTANPVPVTVDGMDCFEWNIFEYVLTPLTSGTIKIPKIKIKGTYRVRDDKSDPFSDSWWQFYNVPFKTQSNELKLKVKK